MSQWTRDASARPGPTGTADLCDGGENPKANPSRLPRRPRGRDHRRFRSSRPNTARSGARGHGRLNRRDLDGGDVRARALRQGCSLSCAGVSGICSKLAAVIAAASGSAQVVAQPECEVRKEAGSHPFVVFHYLTAFVRELHHFSRLDRDQPNLERPATKVELGFRKEILERLILTRDLDGDVWCERLDRLFAAASFILSRPTSATSGARAVPSKLNKASERTRPPTFRAGGVMSRPCRRVARRVRAGFLAFRRVLRQPVPCSGQRRRKGSRTLQS